MINSVRNTTNSELAKELPGHEVKGNQSLDHYLRGNRDLDLAEIRLGEYEDVMKLAQTLLKRVNASRRRVLD
jgi:hypothetical protein